MANPIVWFEVYVQDMPRAKKFYESVFRFEFRKMETPGMEMHGFPSDMNGPGASGALVRIQGVPSGGNSTLVYFRCDDCEVEESRVETAGGRIDRKKMSIGEYGFISLVVDTEGNMIGLHSLK